MYELFKGFCMGTAFNPLTHVI